MTILIMLKSKTESEFNGIFSRLSSLSSPGAPNIFSMSPNRKKTNTKINVNTFTTSKPIFKILLTL